MTKSNTERFIGEFIDNKFERKNCISKICGMSILRNLFMICFFLYGFSSGLNAQAETTVKGDVLYVKLIDGLNGILMPHPQAANTEIIFYVKTGSIFEKDSINGMANLVVKLLNQKINAGIKNSRGQLSPQNVTFEGYTTTERAVFKFTTATQNINAVLTLFRDSVFGAKISQADVNAARNTVLQQLEDARHDNRKIFEHDILTRLYTQDHTKLETLGNAAEIKGFERNTVNNFFKQYYSSNNTILTVTGAFQTPVVQESVESVLRPVVKSEFNPEMITKIVDLRPVVYNTQFIVEDTTSSPEFQICWQFPGTNNNFHDSRCAFLLNAMLNDKNNFIQAKVAKMGAKKFTVQYEANNFNGILRITIQPSKQNFYTTYKFVVTEMARLNKTLVNDIMVGAAKIQFKREYESLKKTKEYPQWVVKHWTFDDESYFPTLLDSVMPLKPIQIENFVIGYLNQSSYVSGLKISKADRQALKVDSVFAELDEDVSRYVFTYKENVTNLEGGDNQRKLQNLLQWANLNPDINIQVNGFSDEHEYSKATDEDSIIAFIDSMPTFLRVSSDIIKKKSTIRPELARAAKIVRYLYDNGIAAERLNGTAMMYQSNNKKEAADNMKCTLTLNKLKKSPSLYEYHYGKKKE